MTFLTITIINIVWILYSLTEGFRDGFYWHFENLSKKECDFDINPVFNFQRGLVLTIISILSFSVLGLFSVINAISLILMFSFFHNGSYYLIRNKLSEDKYPKKWRDESKTFPKYSSFLFSYNKRVIFVILGISLQIFFYIFLLK
jgi:hypothetical protein